MKRSGYITQLKQQKSNSWYYFSAHWLYDDVLLTIITYLVLLF